jgi:hypothetical protein
MSKSEGTELYSVPGRIARRHIPRNEESALCEQCGNPVPAGKGYQTQVASGRILVEHPKCFYEAEKRAFKLSS